MGMKIVIKEAIGKNVKEGFYVYIDYMYGDADGFVTRTYGPFYKNEEKYLLKFLSTLDECLEAYPNGRGGFENYEDVVESLKDWDSYNYNGDGDNEMEELVDRIDFRWETCPDGYGCQASIEGYEVKFFDSTDKQYHRVEIIEE